ncbi:MAG: hypothetical protein EKK48_26315 [Candidatus Melainabacteria bacterium]|nr:MAG: hypothetical protein EKK48_26315 [Candidatus Melainabacteria bacterium]
MERRRESIDEIIASILDHVVPAMLNVDWRTHHLAQSFGWRDSNRTVDAGFDIQHVAQWSPGERVDDIASAATGWTELLTTVYQDQTPLDIIVIADASPTLAFGTERTSKSILSAEIQTGIFVAAEQRGDNIGSMVYSDARLEWRMLTQPASMESLQEGLWLYLSTSAPPSSATPVAESGLMLALANVPSNGRALVFVLSDFANLSQGDMDALLHTASMHDVCCVMLEDRREEELPSGSGVRQLRDLRTGATSVVSLTEQGRKRWREEYRRHKDQVLKQLTDSCGCTVWTFRTGDDPAEALAMLLAGAS